MIANPIESNVPPIVHLGALRELELVNNGNVFMSQLRRIDLRSLSCTYLNDSFHDISPRFPVTITELTLDVRDIPDCPRFGESTPPAFVFRLPHHEESRYLPILSWIENCLNCLAFPHGLHRLDIQVLTF